MLFFLKEYTKECVLGPLFKLLEACFELFVPLVVAALIDRGIGGGDRGFILRMCLVLAGLGVVGMFSAITAQYFAARAAVGMSSRLREALFAHLQTLSYSQLDRLGTSNMITRMTSDMNQIQTGVNLFLRISLRSPFVVLGAMVMAFTVDARAALVFAAAIPALSLVVFGVMLWCIPLYKKVQAGLDRILGLTRENLTGVRVIRAFCKEDEEIAGFREKNEALTRLQKFTGRISALMNPASYVIVNLSVVALVWIGALRVNTGVLSQGQVVALYNYMTQILIELIKLAATIIAVTKAVASANRVQEIFELPSGQEAPEKIPEARAEPGAVSFRGVGLRYHSGGDSALADISFEAAPGETVGIIGGTGSGKTSLVNLIPRFYDASEGTVLVDGVDVRDYPLDALRLKIGLVPQKAVLFQGTIRENLHWGRPDATDEALWEALELAQAREVVQGKGGLDALVEQGGGNLSGGQRQRLTIARALVRRPEILILDDSASALDYATDAALRKALGQLPYRPTVFIVSQRAASVRHADKIIVLDDGAVAGIGKSEELLETCGTYREIYDSQLRKE